MNDLPIDIAIKKLEQDGEGAMSLKIVLEYAKRKRANEKAVSDKIRTLRRNLTELERLT